MFLKSFRPWVSVGQFTAKLQVPETSSTSLERSKPPLKHIFDLYDWRGFLKIEFVLSKFT